jgi:hypothetical protein
MGPRRYVNVLPAVLYGPMKLTAEYCRGSFMGPHSYLKHAPAVLYGPRKYVRRAVELYVWTYTAI